MSIKPVELRPVLHVSNLNAALTFYKEVLGCAQQFVFEDRYAGIGLGDVAIHLSQGGGMFGKPIGGTNLYIFLDSPAAVDACYAEIVSKGGKVDSEPQNYPYGMRDFVAFDPDGNMLSFGAEIPEG